MSDVCRRTSHVRHVRRSRNRRAILESNERKAERYDKEAHKRKRRGERRENRDEAIALVNGIEAAVYSDGSRAAFKYAELLSDIAVLRGHLYDRSAPVKMILEHLSLVIPKDLV